MGFIKCFVPIFRIFAYEDIPIQLYASRPLSILLLLLFLFLWLKEIVHILCCTVFSIPEMLYKTMKRKTDKPRERQEGEQEKGQGKRSVKRKYERTCRTPSGDFRQAGERKGRNRRQFFITHQREVDKRVRFKRQGRKENGGRNQSSKQQQGNKQMQSHETEYSKKYQRRDHRGKLRENLQ